MNSLNDLFAGDSLFTTQLILTGLIILFSMLHFKVLRNHLVKNDKVEFLLFLSGFCTFIATLFFGIHADIISQYDRFKIQKNNWFNFETIYTYPLQQVTLQKETELFSNKEIEYNSKKQSLVLNKKSYVFVVDKSYSTKANPIYTKYSEQLINQLKANEKLFNENEDFVGLDLPDLLLMAYLKQIYNFYKNENEGIVDVIFYYGQDPKGNEIKRRISTVEPFNKAMTKKGFASFQDTIKNILIKGKKIPNQSYKTNYAEIIRICSKTCKKIEQEDPDFNSQVLTIIGDFEHETESLHLSKEIMELPLKSIYQTNLVVIPNYKQDDEPTLNRIDKTLELFKNKHFRYSYLYSFDTNETRLYSSPINIVKSALAITDSSSDRPEIFLFKPYKNITSYDVYKAKLHLDGGYGDSVIVHFTGKTDDKNICALINDQSQVFLNVPQYIKNEDIELSLTSNFANVIDLHLEIIPKAQHFRLRIPINLTNKLPNNSAWFLVFAIGLLYTCFFLIILGNCAYFCFDVLGHLCGINWLFSAIVVFTISIITFILGLIYFKLQTEFLYEKHKVEFSILTTLQLCLIIFSVIPPSILLKKTP